MEKELAAEFTEILRQYNVKSISIYKLLAEIEIAIIKHVKIDHISKADVAVALKINRTTLSEKMKRFKLTV
jgi:DNA-binding NtrC family response regulator